MRGHLVTLNIVPPVADKELLVEESSIWTEKGVFATSRLTDVENLGKKIKLKSSLKE